MAGRGRSPEEEYLGLYSQAWSDELVSQASAELVVEGVRLPAHKEILMLRSRVVCGMLADLGLQEGPLILEAPLEGFTAHQVALLLRFIYHPQLITSVNFAALHQHLPPLLRLAHKLDVPVLVEAISSHIISHTGCATLKTLQQWAQVSQACQLDKLHAICVCRLAAKLAGEGNTTKKGMVPVKAALQAAQQLRHCDQDVLLQVIAVLAANTKSVDLQVRCHPDLLRAAAAEVHSAPVAGNPERAGAGADEAQEPEAGRGLGMLDAHVEMLLQDFTTSCGRRPW